MRAARRLLLVGALAAPAAAATPRSPDGCVRAGPSARVVRIVAGRRDPIEAVALGRGADAVVLANESDRDLCAWLPFARTLEHGGYRVLLFDFGGGEPWTEVSAVAWAARRLGATRVFLVGASEGAKAAIVAAARHTPAAGIVSLSAERYLGRRIDVQPFAARLRLPILFVTARSDPFAETDTPGLYRACRSPDKRLLRVRGDAHGVALLEGRAGPLVRARVLAFLRSAR